MATVLRQLRQGHKADKARQSQGLEVAPGTSAMFVKISKLMVSRPDQDQSISIRYQCCAA
jgi:hypothetical protein